ncbi:MAG: glycosyltransferase, partial [Planctomycetaceae bacterium]|nr:glycosyltransferase [Planctomycetaceae bacterium]
MHTQCTEMARLAGAVLSNPECEVPEVRWEFVGCPDAFRQELSQACQQRATFHAANWEARSHLNRWHVLLYHNPDVVETFGRTVAEAMRAGCVPVVDNAGGFCEQIGPQNGYLCSELQEFMTALEELSSRETWKKRSTCCRETAEDLF